MKQQWSFSAMDTLFFRESRPMESIGGGQLGSVFPPPARTIIGAIRTSIGEALSVDWSDYASGAHPLHAIMGTSEHLGPLRFTGPYLLSHGERLYSPPLACLRSSNGQTRLRPAARTTTCDLGNVYLPVKEDTSLAGARPLEQAFITEAGLRCFLSGQRIAEGDIRPAIGLYTAEERLGIARDNRTRVTGGGLLYQTRHIRPVHSAGLQIGMSMTGLAAPDLPEQGMARLGAEGRLAAWQRAPATALPAISRPAQARGLLLMLLTPALFDQGWLPDGFASDRQADALVWQGELAGIRLRLVSSAVGKPVREGGWDMVQRAPRSLASYVPAGSCYFCEVLNAEPAQAQATLHGLQIGQETEYGRGELAVGYW
jgi:CRISPR-associated protein Cmr3